MRDASDFGFLLVVALMMVRLGAHIPPLGDYIDMAMMCVPLYVPQLQMNAAIAVVVVGG